MTRMARQTRNSQGKRLDTSKGALRRRVALSVLIVTACSIALVDANAARLTAFQSQAFQLHRSTRAQPEQRFHQKEQRPWTVRCGMAPSDGDKSFSSSSASKPGATVSASASATNSNSRSKQIQRLVNWGAQSNVNIQSGGVEIQYRPDSYGLGIVNSRPVPKDSVVVSVPSSTALTVESGGGPDDISVMLSSSGIVTDRPSVRALPWYVQFSLYLHKLDKICSQKGSVDQQKTAGDDSLLQLGPWLVSLPRTFTTPIHWSDSTLKEMQYAHMSDAVQRQEVDWKQHYQKLAQATTVTTGKDAMKWEDFLWGCEIARSRAFSSGYGGSAFNPATYLFTLVLVVAYLGLNLGTVEQAANGAALVVCASILRDFVLPKLSKTKKYVICPIIDMCNHRSSTMGTNANVAFEFFADAYSLSAIADIGTISSTPQQEVFISYGDRSNDQLLQYYGFVEANNPHDVFVMPPLRSWDIAALEEACGGPFAAGRLSKLERAGLLGVTSINPENGGDDEESSGNPLGGVVLTRADGIDPAVIQALRVLVATESEWMERAEAVGNFATEISAENERKARLAAKIAINMELEAKPTSLEEDVEILKRMESKKGVDIEEKLAIAFRIEKKKVLKEAAGRLV